MKKIFLVVLILFGLLQINQSMFAQTEETEQAKIDSIKNDPDWQIIAQSQGKLIDFFISGDINIKNFDFNDESLFLNTIRMSKQEYFDQVRLAKEAGGRLMAKFDIASDRCNVCTKTHTEQINTFKSVLLSFKNNRDAYSAFKTHSLGIEPRASVEGFRCCRFWYYVCATICTTTITTVGPFLLCIALCAHEYCCNPVLN